MLVEGFKNVNEKIKNIDFSKLWPGFHQFEFSLYNKDEACVDGKIIKKPDSFIGNTTVKYQGKDIAIWNLSDLNYDIDILTSKIIHEMFHAYQAESLELRYPNELEGLNYPIDTLNYSYKFEENLILGKIVRDFNVELFNKFLNIRKIRSDRIGNFFNYESRVEIIEGMAQYVELMALKLLNLEKYQNTLDKIIMSIKKIDEIFDVRKNSYDVGSLLLLTLDANNIEYIKDLKAKKTINEMLINQFPLMEVSIPINEEIEYKAKRYLEEKKNLIYKVLNNATFSFEVNSTLIGFDPYNAKKYMNYIYHPYFIILKDNKGKNDILYGTYVTKMKDSMIVEKYYKL